MGEAKERQKGRERALLFNFKKKPAKNCTANWPLHTQHCLMGKMNFNNGKNKRMEANSLCGSVGEDNGRF